MFQNLTRSPLYLLILITLAVHSAHSCLFQSIGTKGKQVCDGPGDFDKPFESKRTKSLDCTCGTIPTDSNPPKNFLFPWQVLISHSSSVPGKICRGTIINDRVILTSASCILKVAIEEILDNPAKAIFFPNVSFAQPEELQVRLTSGGVLGSTPLQVKHIYHNPLHLFKRALYNKVDYDIALVTLKSPLEFSSTLVPVCLPHSSKSGGDLAGVESIFSRWHMNNNNPQDITEQMPPFSSFFFPKVRCRLNAGHHWITDRFVCTLTPTLAPMESVEVGGALMGKNGNQYTQYGIHSWRTYHPLIFNRKPVSLASDVKGYLKKIENYSAEMEANWCDNGLLKGDGIPKKSSNFNETLINEPIYPGWDPKSSYPWLGTNSELRIVRKTCKCGLVNSRRKANARIVSGQDATPYEYGWQVQLIFKYEGESNQLCGGSLISDRIILTAAHCVYKEVQVNVGISGLVRPENVLVYLHRYTGSNDRDDKSRLAGVESIVPHPRFTVDSVVKNDIALLVLRKRVCFECLIGKVSPLCLPKTGESLNLDGRTDAKVIGWGRMDALDPGSKASKLQEVEAKIISREMCIELTEKLGNNFFMRQVKEDENKLCAGNFLPPWDYMDPAQGDSGSPLFLPINPGTQTMIHVGLASIISTGEEAVKRMDEKTVTFYTKTQSYLDFIDYYSLAVEANWCER